MSNENEYTEALNQLEKIEKEEQEQLNFKNYLEQFDEAFETNTKEQIQITPVLLKLFNEFIQQIYEPSPLYKLAIGTKNKITEELEKNLTNEQKCLFEQWKTCENKMLDDMVEQAFIYGYAMCYQLINEVDQKYQLKEGISSNEN